LRAQVARAPRIGLLANASAQPLVPEPIRAFQEAMRQLGYIEGRTIEIEYRWAEGRAERLPELAADLVRTRVDLIVASGDAPIRAAMAATRSIPIVMATSGDAVGAGFVASLARPGGNVTGMTAINPELGAKRLQLLGELLPQARRIAMLWNPHEATHAIELESTRSAAKRLGLALAPTEISALEQIDAVLERLAQTRADALLVFNDTLTVALRERLVQAAARLRLPAMYEAREWAVAGGLLAYGVTHVDLYRQCALHVDRILKGAAPSSLPVEQPTKVRLTINLASAKMLGIAIPQSLLLRADEVIQ
jgi:putative tryptophan/tyrosine transport system substrate-binding protein